MDAQILSRTRKTNKIYYQIEKKTLMGKTEPNTNSKTSICGNTNDDIGSVIRLMLSKQENNGLMRHRGYLRHKVYLFTVSSRTSCNVLVRSNVYSGKQGSRQRYWLSSLVFNLILDTTILQIKDFIAGITLTGNDL